MKQPLMTQAEYLEAHGQLCPFCGSSNIRGGIPQVEGQEAWQDVTCNDCHHNWQDTFKMVGFTTEFSEQPGDEVEP